MSFLFCNHYLFHFKCRPPMFSSLLICASYMISLTLCPLLTGLSSIVNCGSESELISSVFHLLNQINAPIKATEIGIDHPWKEVDQAHTDELRLVLQGDRQVWPYFSSHFNSSRTLIFWCQGFFRMT